MNVKLLTEHHLEFLSLTGGCTGSSESTLATLLEITFHSSFTEVSGCKLVIQHCLSGHGESVWQSFKRCHLVIDEQAEIQRVVAGLVKSMFNDTRSMVRVGDGSSLEFSVEVGVYQGSVLSRLLIIVRGFIQ